MLDRNRKRFVEANTHWSSPTRARISAFGLPGMTTLFARKLNQSVAPGPKTAVRLVWAMVNIGVGLGTLRRIAPSGLCGRSCGLACRRARRHVVLVHRRMRRGSGVVSGLPWTACWDGHGLTEVVMLCVRIGRAASFRWYLYVIR